MCGLSTSVLWVRIRAQFFLTISRVDEVSSPSTSCAPADSHKLLVFIWCSDVLVFIRKNILNSSLSWRVQKIIHDTDSYAFQPATILPNISCLVFETLLCFLLCLIYCKHVATAQIAPIFFFVSVSLLLPIIFTSHCLSLLYSESLLTFCF